MITIRKANDVAAYLIKPGAESATVGFVPTMGALHAGHLSLINESKKRDAITVASIFVNPVQFNDPKDFENYPTTLESDINILEQAGCDLLFLPSVSEMYPNGLNFTDRYELGEIEKVLEGEYRPGHFQGVCRVVHRLLSVIPCKHLYLGQKDFQQCMVIKKLVALKQIPTEIIICPTKREADGLAMSSRNIRLAQADREPATSIFKALQYIKNNIKPGDITNLKTAATQQLTEAGFTVDYIEIAETGSLDIVTEWNGTKKLVALAAAFLGNVRLIDNLLLQD